MRRLRGLKSLLHEAVDLTTELVREGHESSARSLLRVVSVIEPLAEPARAADEVRRSGTDGILAAIRGVNRAIEGLTDAGLDGVEQLVGSPHDREQPAAREVAVPLRSDLLGSWPWLVDAGVGLLNGTIGDHLHLRKNGLGLGLSLRYGAEFLPEDLQKCRQLLGEATPKLAIFVHGLGTTEWSWCFGGALYHGDPEASFASLLARDLGYTPLLVRYNSGRHVSESGRHLAQEIQRVLAAWPTPVEEIVLIGHSMGGLVARSACHYGSEHQRSGVLPTDGWVDKVRHVFCLGAPHRGAPLEKLGHVATAILGAVDAPGTRIPARLARARSSGIKDMRHGSLVDEDWLGRDPDVLGDPPVTAVPLLPRARYYFVSATITRDVSHPLGKLLGDLVVLVPSARGPCVEQHAFPIETRHYGGVVHHHLQNHPGLYAQIREACAAGTGQRREQVTLEEPRSALGRSGR